MHYIESDVVILKPTPSFLTFLTDQQPDLDLSDVRLLRTNHTAYTIAKCDTDEATLDEVERHFPAMFRHEICRLLGENASDHFEASFLDFLMCFKFELHSQIVVMEPSIEQGHQLLCVKPRTVLLKWMKSTLTEHHHQPLEILDRMNLSHIAENATVLVKNFEHLADVKPFIQKYYRPIFKAEMLRMCTDADQWPEIDTFQTFRRYFAVEIHSQLIHLNASSPALRDSSLGTSRYALNA
jgi:hypothetical protein